MTFAIEPPIEPMLAKLADELPVGDAFCTSPSGMGFARSSFAADPSVFIQSRDLRPLDRYFPELHEVLLARLAGRLRGRRRDRDRDAARARFRRAPAAASSRRLARRQAGEGDAGGVRRVRRCSRIGGRDLRDVPQSERRGLLEQALADAEPPIHLTPMTRDRAVASEWLSRFEGAGLDGVIAKPEDGTYEPGKRAMIKVKHARTADCVVAGFRWHKTGKDELVGSLLLGLYDDQRRRCTTSA